MGEKVEIISKPYLSLLLFDSWDIKTGKYDLDEECWCVGIEVTLRAVNNGLERTIDQYGVNKCNRTKDEIASNQRPSGDSIHQAVKSAISDGMKKCSSWLGVGSHVFRGDIKAIKPLKWDKSDNMIYSNLVERLSLNQYDYKNGIPILPDRFKPFYQKMEWDNGIFESDLQDAIKGTNSRQQHSRPQSQPQGNSSKGNQQKNQQSAGAGKSNKNEKTISKQQAKYICTLAQSVTDKKIQESDVVQAVRTYLEGSGVDVKSEFGDGFNEVKDLPEKYVRNVIQFFENFKKEKESA